MEPDLPRIVPELRRFVGDRRDGMPEVPPSLGGVYNKEQEIIVSALAKPLAPLAALGMTLPLNYAVEIEGIFEVRSGS